MIERAQWDWIEAYKLSSWASVVESLRRTDTALRAAQAGDSLAQTVRRRQVQIIGLRQHVQAAAAQAPDGWRLEKEFDRLIRFGMLELGVQERMAGWLSALVPKERREDP